MGNLYNKYRKRRRNHKKDGKHMNDVSDDRYDIIVSRFSKFQKAMSNPELEVVKVFDPLNQKQLDELELIREVSKDLQKKKEEDVNKSAQAEAESKKEVIEEVEPAPEEKKEA